MKQIPCLQDPDNAPPVKRAAVAGYGALIEHRRTGRMSRLAVPTTEHYMPLLYAIALQTPDESVAFFCEGLVLGSVSMRGLVIR